jgi:citronellol/citronellal dehydrogenase
MKRFDLMQQINTRGTFLVSKYAVQHLKKSKNAHILNISPPLSMDKKFFAPHVAYTIAKYGMSLCVLGMSEEFREDGVAVNALWPRTAIATAAVKFALGGEPMMRLSRTDQIMADSAYVVLTS